MLEGSLLGPGSEDQNVVTGVDGLCDCRKKRGVLLDVPRANRVGMMVEMRGREMCVHLARADAGQTHREDFRRQVIDPHHGPPVKLFCLRRSCHSSPLGSAKARTLRGAPG